MNYVDYSKTSLQADSYIYIYIYFWGCNVIGELVVNNRTCGHDLKLALSRSQDLTHLIYDQFDILDILKIVNVDSLYIFINIIKKLDY